MISPGSPLFPRARAFVLDPTPARTPLAEFGGRLKGDERRPSDDDRLMELGKARPWDQVCAEHVGVDNDGPA